MKRKLFGFVAFSMLVSFPSVSSLAQKGTDVERKIKFAKGKSSLTVKDSIADRNTTHTWVAGARAGQKLTVVFTSARKDVDFCIVYPTGTTDDDSCSKRKWTIAPTEAGNYMFIIDSKRENTPYTLAVTIK
jgi:hypothetical protein